MSIEGSGGPQRLSELRQDQVEMTRTRILDALVRTMANGVAAVSMPAVAREAGVSVPTLYRHFGSKRGLLTALAPYVARKAGLVPDTIPSSVAEFGALAHEIFGQLEHLDPALRAAMASELGQELRRVGMPGRRGVHRTMLRRSAPDLADAELEILTDVSVILMSSAAFRAFKDYLGLSAGEAADRVTWALETLVAGANQKGTESEEQR